MYMYTKSVGVDCSPVPVEFGGDALNLFVQM